MLTEEQEKVLRVALSRICERSYVPKRDDENYSNEEKDFLEIAGIASEALGNCCFKNVIPNSTIEKFKYYNANVGDCRAAAMLVLTDAILKEKE